MLQPSKVGSPSKEMCQLATDSIIHITIYLVNKYANQDALSKPSLCAE